MIYKVTRGVPLDELEDHLNSWSRQGWRVLSVHAMMGYMYAIIFERG